MATSVGLSLLHTVTVSLSLSLYYFFLSEFCSHSSLCVSLFVCVCLFSLCQSLLSAVCGVYICRLLFCLSCEDSRAAPLRAALCSGPMLHGLWAARALSPSPTVCISSQVMMAGSSLSLSLSVTPSFSLLSLLFISQALLHILSLSFSLYCVLSLSL